MSEAVHDAVKIGIVSISDRASTGVYEDKGLPALQDWLTRALHNPITFEPRLIPDEQAGISATLIELVADWIRTAEMPGIAWNRLERAMQIWAGACHSRNAGACSNLGQALQVKGDGEQAARAFARACKLGDDEACKQAKPLPPPDGDIVE